VELDPEDPLPYYNRGLTYRLAGDYARAAADFATACFLDPTDPDAANELAWLWATCPDAKYRDAEKALDYAQFACELTGWQDASCLDTLAAAYAVNDRYAEAARWQGQALKLAGDPADEAAYRTRLELYQAGRPFRDRAA
jgi:serine/threonine-protein kinase